MDASKTDEINLLNDLSLWMERHLQTLHHRENKTSYMGSQNPQGYTVAEIPDWELRQKLEAVKTAQKNLKLQIQCPYCLNGEYQNLCAYCK